MIKTKIKKKELLIKKGNYLCLMNYKAKMEREKALKQEVIG